MLHISDIPQTVRSLLSNGTVLPAHPLALTSERTLDEARQRALSRYYLDAGAGGLAVGVHTTQFAIREHGLYNRVLELASEEAHGWVARPTVRVAGIAGKTDQALKEASIATSLGYQFGLVSLAMLPEASEQELLDHCSAIASHIPIIGFYLQSAVGGKRLSFDFWRRFCGIENVAAIKIAPFDRYRSLDVVRAVVAASAEDRITLYTGNDDHIVLDLLTTHKIPRGNDIISIRMKGGLLGHWSVWTKMAVNIHQRCHQAVEANTLPPELLTLDSEVTDCNAAIFDTANSFQGVIAGCHEILRRQGLLKGIWCLDSNETLGPGQSKELDRIQKYYPHLNDDDFVTANLDRWLS